jgi:hypothetical protein
MKYAYAQILILIKGENAGDFAAEILGSKEWYVIDNVPENKRQSLLGVGIHRLIKYVPSRWGEQSCSIVWPEDLE